MFTELQIQKFSGGEQPPLQMEFRCLESAAYYRLIHKFDN